jgi:hypothetical protein
VKLVVVPTVTASELAAVEHALADAGIRLGDVPETYVSPWSRAAVREAVDNEPRTSRYAPSPRSTRGATRA